MLWKMIHRHDWIISKIHNVLTQDRAAIWTEEPIDENDQLDVLMDESHVPKDPRIGSGQVPNIEN